MQGVASNPGELPPGEVIVRIPGAVGPAIGERIRAAAPRDKLHLFTADGRKRVEISVIPLRPNQAGFRGA